MSDKEESDNRESTVLMNDDHCQMMTIGDSILTV